MTAARSARPWYACTGAPCTCPKPASDAVNGRRLAWFTDDELRAELQRRGVVADDTLVAKLEETK